MNTLIHLIVFFSSALMIGLAVRLHAQNALLALLLRHDYLTTPPTLHIFCNPCTFLMQIFTALKIPTSRTTSFLHSTCPTTRQLLPVHTLLEKLRLLKCTSAHMHNTQRKPTPLLYLVSSLEEDAFSPLQLADLQQELEDLLSTTVRIIPSSRSSSLNLRDVDASSAERGSS